MVKSSPPTPARSTVTWTSAPTSLPRRSRARVPHHMIDLVDPDETYTLALYQEQAYRAIDDILARGKLPVLAAGLHST